MKIVQNSTDIPNKIIRKACAFVAGTMENFTLKDVQDLRVKNTKHSRTGYAYYSGCEVVLRIGKANRFPVKSKRLGVVFMINNRIEGLISIIAHEFGHVWQGKKHQTNWRPGGKTSQDVERQCERFEKQAVQAWREKADELLEAWGIDSDCKPKKKAEAKKDIVAERAAKVEANVAKWEAEIEKREKAVKRAKKTLAKWKSKKRYYEKKLSEPRELAAKGSKPRTLKHETVLKNKIAKFIRLYIKDRYGLQSGTHEIEFSEFVDADGEPSLTRPDPNVVADPFVDFFEWKYMKKLVALGDVLEVWATRRGACGEREAFGEDVPIPETEDALDEAIAKIHQ